LWTLEEQYHVKISRSFAALENLNDDENFNMGWVSITGNTKPSTTDTRLL